MTDVDVRRCAPRLRADATRNRERIIAAAQEAFVEHGADAPLDEIARRAGIGNATLYRHFPDRRELIHGVVLALLDQVVAGAETMMADSPDAFTALERFVHETVDWKIGALCPLLSEWMDPNDPATASARDRLDDVVEDMIEQSQAEGHLRTDVGAGDLMVIVSQITRPLPDTNPLDHARFVHRHLQLVLDGMRAPQRSVLPGSPATFDDLRRSCATHSSC